MRAAALVLFLSGCLADDSCDGRTPPGIVTARYAGTTDTFGPYAVDEGTFGFDVDAETGVVLVTFESEGRLVEQQYHIDRIDE